MWTFTNITMQCQKLRFNTYLAKNKYAGDSNTFFLLEAYQAYDKNKKMETIMKYVHEKSAKRCTPYGNLLCYVLIW